MDLIADIGATSSRCALLDDKGQIVARETFANTEFADVESLLEHYLQQLNAGDRPRRAALAVAAPILYDRVQMINIDWQFSQAELKGRLKLAELTVVNDFAAIAWGLPDLNSHELRKVGRGDAATDSPLAVIGPGSGLGVAALIPATDSWVSVSGEGGHVSISPITSTEAAVADYVRSQSGHCSAEDLLSGPGLINIYTALGQLAKRETPSLSAAEISAAATGGDPLAIEAHAMFFSLLGTVAGDLALTVGARGGVFIAGGIIPQLMAPFSESDFRERFEAKGTYRSYMEAIPTYVITAPQPAFRGLRRHLS